MLRRGDRAGGLVNCRLVSATIWGAGVPIAAHEVPANSNAVNILSALGTSGGNASGPVVADGAGDLFGTATYGGADDDGTVFEVTGAGVVVGAPEPTSAALLALACTGLLGRRRRHFVGTSVFGLAAGKHTTGLAPCADPAGAITHAGFGTGGADAP